MPFDSGLFTGVKQGHQVQRDGEVPRLLCRVGAAVVGEMLDRVWSSHGAEALLDGLQHHVANDRSR